MTTELCFTAYYPEICVPQRKAGLLLSGQCAFHVQPESHAVCQSPPCELCGDQAGYFPTE